MAGVSNTSDSEPTVHGSAMASAAPHIVIGTNKEKDADYLETVRTHQSVEYAEGKTQNAIEALGIEDWQAKEKKIVRRLDTTLLPQLWILYSAFTEDSFHSPGGQSTDVDLVFNYLNRVNIA